MVTYNQRGESRGIATISFFKPEAAAKAANELNGLLVDGKTMKVILNFLSNPAPAHTKQVEVVVDAQHAPAPAPVKTLSDRVAQPKAQPRPATVTKASAGNAGTRGRGAARGRGARRGRNANRPKPKTAEELDAEMVDYFDGGAGNPAPAGESAANGTTATANGGEEMGMDEIS